MPSSPIPENLRVLVAIAVLQHKPVNKSHWSYVQEIRAAFPVDVSPANQDVLWKRRAMELEKECKTLKQTLETSKIQALINDKNSTSQSSSSQGITIAEPTNATAIAVVPSKKKAKSKQQQNPPSSNPLTTTDQAQADQQRQKPLLELRDVIKKMYPGKKSKSREMHGGALFQALDDYLVLANLHSSATPSSSEDSSTCIRIAATRRALEAIAISLNHSIKKDMDFDRLQDLGTLLVYITKDITVASDSSPLPSPLSGSSSLHDTLLNSILIPIVRSFYMLSTKNLAYLLNYGGISSTWTNKSPQAILDARPALLALLQQIIGATATSKSERQKSSRQNTSSKSTIGSKSLEVALMLHALAADTVQHLQQILEERTKATNNAHVPDANKRSARVKRLVVKDTLWYLCSVLHVLANALDDSRLPSKENHPPTDPGGTKIGRLHLLKKTIINCLVSFLVVYQDDQDDQGATGAGAHPGAGAAASRENLEQEKEKEGETSKVVENNDSTDMLRPQGTQDEDNYKRSCASNGDNACSASPRRVNTIKVDNGNISIGNSNANPLSSIRTAITLDQTERGMLLRVAESYFEIC